MRVHFQALQQLRAHALQGVGIKARLVECQGQHGEGLIAVFRKRLEGAAEIIGIGVERKAHGQFLLARLEFARGQVASPFVEHGGEEIGKALGVSRVLRGTALEREVHGNKRYGVIFHQPSRNAAGACDLFDGEGLRGGGDEKQPSKAGGEEHADHRVRLNSGQRRGREARWR